MNYYLNNYPKTKFYYLGKTTPTEFVEGRGMKFIKEYLGDFPFLINEISVIDELNNTISFYDFLKNINKK
tara:strand:+ start:370 stop:579 length:210 start_codon:yes stop_codon:yes gene_type:complete